MKFNPLTISFIIFILIPTVAKSFEYKTTNININFVVLTKNPEVNKSITIKLINESIARLNNTFKTDHGDQIVFFTRKNIRYFKEIKDTPCNFLDFGTQMEKPAREHVYDAYNNCHDTSIKDPKSINFYIFESLWEENTDWKTSYAFFNWFRQPFIMVNWKTFVSGYKVPDVHEMGHILGGLLHLEACGSTDFTHTNIMAGLSDSCEGTAGDRSLGFNDWQLQLINSITPIVANSLK